MDERELSGAPGAPTRGLFVALLPAHAGQAMTISLLAPVVPAIAVWFGGGKTGNFWAQIIAVTPFLGIIIGGIGSGFLIKIAGLRQFVLMAACLYATGGALGLIAPNLSLLIIASLLLGLGAIFVLSGLSALTAVAYGEAERGKVVGVQAAIAGLCNVIFGLSGAFLAETLGWRVPFGFFVAYGVIVMALTLMFVPSIRRGGDEAPVEIGFIVKRAWPVLLAGALVFLTIVSQATQIPFLMAEHGLTTSGMRGVVLTVIAALSMLGSLLYGLLQNRISETVLIILLGICGTASWILFGVWTGGLLLILLAATLMGTCQGLLVPMLFGATMRAVPGEASGPAIGLLNVAICVGSFLNPVLLSPVRSALGLAGVMFLLGAATLVIAIAALLWSSKARSSFKPAAQRQTA